MKGEMPVQLLVSLVLLRVVYKEGLMGAPTGGKLAASEPVLQEASSLALPLHVW